MSTAAILDLSTCPWKFDPKQDMLPWYMTTQVALALNATATEPLLKAATAIGYDVHEPSPVPNCKADKDNVCNEYETAI